MLQTVSHLRPQIGLSAVLAALFALGCGSSPPPPPSEPEPTETVSKPIEEPARPPCSTLADRCESDSETRAPVPMTGLVFAPPDGWLFAAEPEVTLAQTPDGGPCLAISTYELTGDLETNRSAAMSLLIRSVGVELPGDGDSPVANWDEPDAAEGVGGRTVELWQKEGGSRASKNGPVLLFQFEIDETRTAMGIGFVPQDDTTEADAKIMEALGTVGEGEVIPPAVTADEGAEE